MSNETKRDVFEYYLEMIKALKDPLAAETVREARQRYAAALPDDLPVIPKAVTYAIEWFQQNDETIGEVWRNLYEDVDDDWHECPQLREAEEWMLDNQDTFTRAWVLGQWEAEK